MQLIANIVLAASLALVLVSAAQQQQQQHPAARDQHHYDRYPVRGAAAAAAEADGEIVVDCSAPVAADVSWAASFLSLFLPLYPFPSPSFSLPYPPFSSFSAKPPSPLLSLHVRLLQYFKGFIAGRKPEKRTKKERKKPNDL